MENNEPTKWKEILRLTVFVAAVGPLCWLFWLGIMALMKSLVGLSALDVKDDGAILQAAANIFGSILSGIVAAIVAILILHREQNEARRVRAQEVKETSESLTDILGYFLQKTNNAILAANAEMRNSNDNASVKLDYYKASQEFAKLRIPTEIRERVAKDLPLLAHLVDRVIDSTNSVSEKLVAAITKVKSLSHSDEFIVDLKHTNFVEIVVGIDELISAIQNLHLRRHGLRAVMATTDDLYEQMSVAVEIANALGKGVTDTISKRYS